MQQMISCCEIKNRLYGTQLREGKADGDGRVELCDKVNNLLNSGGSVIRLLQKVLWHNLLFVDTAYSLHAFTGFDGSSVMPILKQAFVHGAVPATDIEIETYMADAFEP